MSAILYELLEAIQDQDVQRSLKVLQGIGENKEFKFLNGYYAHQPLVSAVKFQLYEVCLQLVKIGLDTNQRQPKTMYTPLHVAAQTGNTQIVDLLIKASADTSLQDIDGYYPVHHAIQNRHYGLINQLLQNIEDINLIIDPIQMETLIFYAVRANDGTLCENLIQKGANLNFVNLEGLLPIHLAIYIKHKEVFQIMFENIENPNTVDKNGESFLAIAAMHKCYDICEILYKSHRGLNINNRNQNGDTAMHKLSKFGSAELISNILSNHKVDKQIINSRNNNSDTPLNIAVQSSNPKIVRCLLQQGARLDVINDHGDTPLHLVAKNNNVKIGEILMEFGGARSLNCKNDDGMTPLQIVDKQSARQLERIFLMEQDCFRQQKKVVIKREDYCGPLDQLHNSVIHNQIDLFKSLLERQVNVNRRNWEGFRCIDLALKYQRYEIFAMLIDHPKCNVQALNMLGMTVFQTALHEVKFQYLKLLLEKRSENLNAFNGGGYTLLHTAINSSMFYLCKMLVASKGVDVNLRNGQSQTPLFMASQLGNAQIVQLLLQHKACTALTDNQNQTALHIAAINGHKEVCKLILESHNNNVNQLNSKNESALHLAIENGHTEVAYQLIMGGSKINYDIWLMSPLHTAVKHNQLEIIKMLIATFNLSSNFRHPFTNETPLHIANSHNLISIAKYLINMNADLMIPNKRMLYPFCAYSRFLQSSDEKYQSSSAELAHYSWMRQKIDKLLGEMGGIYIFSRSIEFNNALVYEDYLKDPKYSVDTRNPQGDTMLHVAAINGSERFIEAAVNQNLDLLPTNAIDLNNTPLHKACQFNNVGVISLIGQGLKSKNQINIKNDQGNTPLHLAATGGYLDSCIAVIKLGANINIENKRGYTPIQLAISKNRTQLVEYFIKLNPKILSNFENSLGDSLLNVAVEYGNLDICKMLMDYFNFNFKNNTSNKKALEASIQRGQYQVSKMLIDHHMNNMQAEGDKNQAPIDKEWIGHLATVNKQSQILKYVVSNGADINAKDKTGYSSLHITAKQGYLQVCKYLLDAQANPNQIDCEGNTPLHLAILHQHVEVSRILAQHQREINQPNANKDSPLHCASKSGNLRICNLLLEKGANPNQLDLEKNTPLHVAAKQNRWCVLQQLQQKVQDINQQNGQGNTVLHIIMAQDIVSESVFKELIQSGIRIDTQNKDSQTPLQMSIVKGKTHNFQDVASYFSNQDLENQELVHWAAEHNQVQILSYLLSRNLAINTLNSNGLSSIYLGVLKGYEQVCKMLIKADADVNQQNKNKEKDFPLHGAVYSNKKKVVAQLLAHGAQQHRVDTNKNNPLNLAIQLRRKSIFVIMMKLLPKTSCQAFHKIQKQNVDGFSLMHTAVQSNDLIIVQKLTQAQLDVNIQNINGDTPLHFAARQGNSAMCELLIQNNGNPSIQNNSGNTPWMTALVKGNIQLLEGFLDIYNLELGIQNNHGDTLIHMLIQNNQFPLLELVTVKHQSHQNLNEMFSTTNQQKLSPLHLACMYGHLHYLDLLEKFIIVPNINQQDINGNTALHLAAQYHHTTMCERLIKVGFNVHKQNFSKHNPLQVAILDGVLPRDNFSLNYGVSHSFSDSFGSEPLSGGQEESQISESSKLSPAKKSYNSTETQAQIETCKLLLVQGGKGSQDADRTLSILQIALERAYYQICTLLVELGFVSELPIQQKMRMVEIAVINNHKPLFDLLFDKTQDINLSNQYGDTLLHVAAIRNCSQIAMQLIREGANMELGDKNGFTPIFGALKAGNIDLGYQLLIAGANPANQKNVNGDNLLHHVLQLENTQVAENLISIYEVELKAVNNRGQNALHLAAQIPNGLEICNKLVQKGVNINSIDENGNTPIFYSCAGNQQKTFAYLVQGNANITHVNQERQTILHVVAGQALVKLAQNILGLPKSNSLVSSLNANGNTPLHLASKMNSLEICKLLISRKAEVNAINRTGYTPLFLAVQEGNDEVCQLLARNEAEINLRSPVNKQTPLHVSILQRKDQVTITLLKLGADPGMKYKDKQPYELGKTSVVPKSWNNFDNLRPEQLKQYFTYPVFELCYRKQYKFIKYLKEKDSNYSYYMQTLSALSGTSILNFHPRTSFGSKTGNYSHLQISNNSNKQIMDSSKNISQVDTPCFPSTPSSSQIKNTSNNLSQLQMSDTHSKIAQLDAQQSRTPKQNSNVLQLLESHNSSTHKKITQLDAQQFPPPDQNANVLQLLETNSREMAQLESQSESQAIPDRNTPELPQTPKTLQSRYNNNANFSPDVIHKLRISSQNSNRNSSEFYSVCNTPQKRNINPNGIDLIKEEPANVTIDARFSDDKNDYSEEKNQEMRAASQKGHLFTCVELIKQGADPNLDLGDKYQSKLLHYIAFHGLHELIAPLIQFGANINSQNSSNSTPLHLASVGNHLDACNTLIQNGSNVNALDRHNYTPLHLAAYRGLDQICQALIEAGCDMDIRGTKNFTPLHVAAQEGRASACMALIKAGADPCLTNDYGKTPCQQNHLSVIPKGWKNVRGPFGFSELSREYKQMYCTYEVFSLCFQKKYKFLDYMRKYDPTLFNSYIQRFQQEHFGIINQQQDIPAFVGKTLP